MSKTEALMTKLDDSMHLQADDDLHDIHDLLASVPWARESLQTYLNSQRPKLEDDVRAFIDELLASL
jgi:hypothetical protein